MPFFGFFCPCGASFAVYFELSLPSVFACPLCQAVLEFEQLPSSVPEGITAPLAWAGTWPTRRLFNYLSLPLSRRLHLAWTAALGRTHLTPADLLEQLMEFPLAADLAEADRQLDAETAGEGDDGSAAE